MIDENLNLDVNVSQLSGSIAYQISSLNRLSKCLNTQLLTVISYINQSINNNTPSKSELRLCNVIEMHCDRNYFYSK